MEQYNLDTNYALLGRLLIKLDSHQGMVQDIAKQMQQLKAEIQQQERAKEQQDLEEMLSERK